MQANLQLQENGPVFATALVQHCLLPRLLIDPAEAIYCAKFLHTIINISKLKSSTIFYLMKDVTHTILPFLCCATEKETVNIAIFYNELLIPF